MLAQLNEFPDRPKLLSPTTMAYIGDSVFELFIRTYLMEDKIRKPNQLHQQAIDYVNAEAQADLLDQLRSDLTEEEKTIVRRGRNVSTGGSGAKDRTAYQYSTAFEALLGYLYLAEEEARLKELFGLMRQYYQEQK